MHRPTPVASRPLGSPPSTRFLHAVPRIERGRLRPSGEPVAPPSRKPLGLLAAGEMSVDLSGRGLGYVVSVVSVWLVAGLITAALLGRRGHELPPLVALGMVFGPLMIPYARVIIRDTTPRPYFEVRPGSSDSGDTEMVVLVTGPAEDSADVLDLVRRLADPKPRLALAVEAPLEASQPVPGQTDPWLRRLTDAALLFEEFHPRLIALRGRPATSLASLVAEEPVRTVIVTRRSRRNRRLARALRGPLVVFVEDRR